MLSHTSIPAACTVNPAAWAVNRARLLCIKAATTARRALHSCRTVLAGRPGWNLLRLEADAGRSSPLPPYAGSHLQISPLACISSLSLAYPACHFPIQPLPCVSSLSLAYAMCFLEYPRFDIKVFRLGRNSKDEAFKRYEIGHFRKKILGQVDGPRIVYT